MSKKRNKVSRHTIEFENICKMHQRTLKKHMRKQLEEMYDEVVCDDGFIFAKGTVPILLVAHMDTVHKELPRVIVYQDGKLSSPQGIGGDDRCGIYMISKIIQKHHCSVLFTEDEEIGGIGAGKFVKHSCIDDLEFNYIIELDRKGSDDAVFYDCENYLFEDFITSGEDWSYNFGSYSDICDVAPAIGCAAVNLSCGYYNAHTTNEYVVFEEMESNIDKVCRLIERTSDADVFEYIEAKNKWSKYNFDGYYYDSLYEFTGKSDADIAEWGINHYFVISYVNHKNKTDWEDLVACSKYEAIGMFMESHPNLAFSDIIDIEDYGEDIYSL